jgi:hypothetical protein
LKGFLGVPLLAGLIERETAEVIELSNQVSIEIQTASFRTVRGRTVVASLNDETAFWRTDDGGANPDSEIYAALRPAMATIPNAMLLSGSSPYARRGVLFEDFRKFYGNNEAPVLVWRAATWTMNPLVPQSFLDQQNERDPASFSSEYAAEFRTDVQAFLSREAVDAVVLRDVYEQAPRTLESDYVAFCDPSGGSSDSMTLAIAHREGNRTVLDAIREARPPFSPESVVSEFARLLRSYNISSVTGDRYAGEWPRERFYVAGIEYRCSEKPKSDLYRDLLPMINSGQVELLDHPKLIAQLCSLRRTARGGKDSIDHPPGSHDDVANCVAGALVLAATGTNTSNFLFASVGQRKY